MKEKTIAVSERARSYGQVYWKIFHQSQGEEKKTRIRLRRKIDKPERTAVGGFKGKWGGALLFKARAQLFPDRRPRRTRGRGWGNRAARSLMFKAPRLREGRKENHRNGTSV